MITRKRTWPGIAAFWWAARFRGKKPRDNGQYLAEQLMADKIMLFCSPCVPLVFLLRAREVLDWILKYMINSWWASAWRGRTVWTPGSVKSGVWLCALCGADGKGSQVVGGLPCKSWPWDNTMLPGSPRDSVTLIFWFQVFILVQWFLWSGL